MSEFADYVEKQQSRRLLHGRAQSVQPSDSGYGTESTITEDHAEVVDIIDTLSFAEGSPQVNLEELLLDTSDNGEVTLQQLSSLLQQRLLEGHGETLFDLGQDDDGKSMNFSKEQWDVALDRLRRAAGFLRSECRILLTWNVGGPEEAETTNKMHKGATGKLLIRQNPETTEDVIETRIAVVGNGMRGFFYQCTWADRCAQWMLERVPC